MEATLQEGSIMEGTNTSKHLKQTMVFIITKSKLQIPSLKCLMKELKNRVKSFTEERPHISIILKL